MAPFTGQKQNGRRQSRGNVNLGVPGSGVNDMAFLDTYEPYGC